MVGIGGEIGLGAVSAVEKMGEAEVMGGGRAASEDGAYGEVGGDIE